MKKIENESGIKELYKLSDIDLLRYFKKNPDSLAYYPLAKRLFIKKKFKESIQILLNGIKKFPDYVEPKILLAKLYIKTGNDVEAVQTLREIIKTAPNCADSYYYLSEILFKKGIEERAEILLMKAYEMSPHSPDIKNAYEKRFKKSNNTTTANYNIETTVIESIDDIKKRALRELNERGEEEDSIIIPKSYYDRDILDELEKEFSYKKRINLLIFGGILILVLLIVYLIFNILSENKQQKKQKSEAQLINILNSSVENIEKEAPDRFPDIALYYRLLYHYQINTEKYKNTVKTVKDMKKADTQWKCLAKMTYLLYSDKEEEFNKLYDKAKIKYKDIPDVFLLKGLQLLADNDILNAQSLFDMAYKKSGEANRFKAELASLYLNRGAFSELRSLNIKPTSFETRVFYEFLRKRRFKDQIAVLKDNLKFTENNIQKEKIYIYLFNLYYRRRMYRTAKKILRNHLSQNKIPYYKKLYSQFHKKFKR